MTARPIMFLVSHSSAGGAQEIWVNLADAFRRRGEAVQLFALYPLRETVRQTPPELAWQYVVERQPSGPFGAAKLLWALVRHIRRDRPIAIVCALPAANVLAGVAAQIAGVGTRVIVSHHTPTDTHHPLLDRIDGVTGSLPAVRAVVSVSNTVADTLAHRPARYRAKRRTIHNALPPEIEVLLAEARRGHEQRQARTRTVVATGRLARQKNYPVLVRAALHLPDVTIKIIGNGPDEDALKALTNELGVAGRVHFLGHRPRGETMNILATADVFTQISLFEGHSLGLIEAAKLGLPLIVSNVPVQIEGITAPDGARCGLTVDIDDDLGLAGAITTLLDDPAAYRLWADRSRTLGEQSSFAAMVDAYAALVRS